MRARAGGYLAIVGREDWVGELNSAWKRGDPHLIQLVASGGIGKSTIVWHWLERWKDTGYAGLGAAPALDWSFDSQGQHAYVTHSENFMKVAVEQFGVTIAQDQQPGAEQLGQLVVQKFMESGGVLILDGVEPLQHPPDVRSGTLKDPGLIGFC